MHGPWPALNLMISRPTRDPRPGDYLSRLRRLSKPTRTSTSLAAVARRVVNHHIYPSMETEAVALPEDALAGVLRCLPSRSLAAARCVCKAWRDVVDRHSLLLPHQLPNTVRGIFINYVDHGRPHLFARPSSCSAATTAGPEIDGLLSFMPNDPRADWWSVMDHCDGLLLCSVEKDRRLCVCNPATQRWALLPPPRSESEAITISRYDAGACLAFDPAVSPHYEVALLPDVPRKPMRSDSWKVPKKRPRRRQQEIDTRAVLPGLVVRVAGWRQHVGCRGDDVQRGISTGISAAAASVA